MVPTDYARDWQMDREILELTTLTEISRVMGSTLRLSEVFDRIMGVLSDRIGISRGALVILDESTGKLRIEAALGLSPAEQRRGIYAVGEGVIGSVAATGEPRITPDIRKEPDFLDRTGAWFDETGPSSFISMPIRLENRTVGALSASKPFVDEQTLEDDARLLRIVSAFIAQALQVNRLVRAEKQELLEEMQHLQDNLTKKYTFENIVGSSPAMQEVFETIGLVAKTRATVLVVGETGTGKELIAKAIHYASRRKDKPFIRVHCGALAGTLLESELFGHVQGAFTGALRDKVGRFEAADGGTLFLDEIGTLDTQLQIKLLRVLQEREFERVGDHHTIPVDVRIIAATNADFEEQVRQGQFREDLFYRLNVVMIHLPPLRERLEDIPRLIDHFLDKSNRENGRHLDKLSQNLLPLLMHYPWPGNVRELENALERAVVLSQGEVFTEDLLPVSIRAFSESQQAKETAEGTESLVARLAESACASGNPAGGDPVWQTVIEQVEGALINQALRRCEGVKLKAADFLGINRNTLNKKFKELGLGSE